MGRVKELREQLGLEVRVFGELRAPPKGPTVPKPASPPGPMPDPAPALPSVPARDATHRPRDGSRTRAEGRIAFASLAEDEDIPTPTRRFTVNEITSGLPDESLEADEREAERRLRDLRGRVKAARAAAALTPGLAEVLAKDWPRAAMFYARFGVTEAMFRHGASEVVDASVDLVRSSSRALECPTGLP